MNKIFSRNSLRKRLVFGRTWPFFVLLSALAVLIGQCANHLFNPDAAWGLAAAIHGGMPLCFGLVLGKLMDSDFRAEINPGTNLLLGTQKRVPVPRDYPIEEIKITLDIAANATPPSSPTADGWLKLLKRVQLWVPFADEPRNVVDCSGNFLLEYLAHVGMNTDTATLAALGELNKTTPALIASNKYRLTYRIPLVQPQLAEPLRSRMLLPVHTLKQDPQLILDFAAAAEMHSVGTMDTITCEIVYQQREMPERVTLGILEDGGFMRYDLLETPFVVPVGVSGEKDFDIPTPGHYLGLLLRHYKGANPVTRNDISQTVTAGSETLWSLRVGKRDRLRFRMKTLAIINDESRAKNNVSQTGSPSFSGPLATNTQYQDCSSVYIDFMNDGLGQVNELGGALDCYTPEEKSQLVQLHGFVSAPATNAHTLYIGGHRILERDIERWKAIKAIA
jgi:hypothetical protein